MPAQPQISNELALAAACCLARKGKLARPRQAVDWARFERLVHYHGIAGLAGVRLLEEAPGLIPEDLAQRLTGQLRQDAVLQMAQLSETVRLAERLETNGVRTLVLKGVALAFVLHPRHPERRQSTDIDLLVDPADLPDADRVLRDAGYRRDWPQGDLPGRGHAMLLHLANAFDYVHPVTHQLVELHHRMALNPYCLPARFDELYAGAIAIETAMGPVRGMDGPMFYAYLCWHALGHFDFRLKWMADLAGLLERAGEACGSDYAARDRRIADFPAVSLCDALLGTLAGGGPARRSPARDWSDNVARILAGMERARNMPMRRSLANLPAELANLRFMRRISPGRKSRSYELLRTLCDPRDAAVLGLGPAFSPIYSALGPLLSARRGFLRGRNGPEQVRT